MRLLPAGIFAFTIIILAVSIGTDDLRAQEKEDFWAVDKNDPLNNVNVPFSDGLSMWIVRQKLTLKGYQALIKADVPANNGLTSPKGNTRIDLYLPLIYNKSVSSMVGVQHSTSRILTDVRGMDMGLIHDWFWLVGSYQVDNWKFILGAEYMMNTNRNSLFSKTGDALMPYLTAGYAFSNTWQLICLGGFKRTSMVDDEKTTPVIGLQLRYQPTHTFKIVFGAPVLLASEWTVSQKFHLGCKTLYTGEFSAEAFASFYPHENYSIGLHYNAFDNKTGISYFSNEIYRNGVEQIVYNNLTQYCHSLSLDIGMKVSGDVALVISGGYRLGGKVGLYNNKNHKMDIDGKDEFFISAAVQYLKYFD